MKPIYQAALYRIRAAKAELAMPLSPQNEKMLAQALSRLLAGTEAARHGLFRNSQEFAGPEDFTKLLAIGSERGRDAQAF
jgi:hypothetical protein